MNLQLSKASASDAPALTGISKRSFDSDVSVGAASPGGPPGYMSVPFHAEMAGQGHLHKLTEDGSIVGGALLFLQERVLHVGRIFVDPEHFRKGCGSFMMHEIEGLFPEADEFVLETPVWNARTNAFYSKMGYRETERDREFVHYSKQNPAKQGNPRQDRPPSRPSSAKQTGGMPLDPIPVLSSTDARTRQ